MAEIITLNHHSAAVLPFHVDLEDTVHLILEEKDKGYKPPFFDSGLNFLGGNWEKGVHQDKTPRELVCREINEEFWSKFEATESLNALLGQKFLDSEPEVAAKYDQASIQKIRQIGALITADMRYAGNYIIKVQPPITKTELVYGSTIFTTGLDSEKFKTVEAILKEFDGKVTTDNLKWGSRVVSVTLKEINQKNTKFSWHYCHIVNELMNSGYSFLKPGVIRTLNLVQVSKMNYVPPEGSPDAKIEVGPTFEELEAAGYKFVGKKT